MAGRRWGRPMSDSRQQPGGARAHGGILGRRRQRGRAGGRGRPAEWFRAPCTTSPRSRRCRGPTRPPPAVPRRASRRPPRRARPYPPRRSRRTGRAAIRTAMSLRHASRRGTAIRPHPPALRVRLPGSRVPRPPGARRARLRWPPADGARERHRHDRDRPRHHRRGRLLPWPLAIVVGILAVIFGAIGRRKRRRGEATNGGQALAGIIWGGRRSSSASPFWDPARGHRRTRTGGTDAARSDPL